jgi:hypothetical protein
MVVDFSHSDALRSYGTFNTFRERLAKAAGIRIRKMEGYGGVKPWSEVFDPVAILLKQCDCNGRVPAQCCWTLARRIEDLISTWPVDDLNRTIGTEIVQGLRRAARLRQPFLFN